MTIITDIIAAMDAAPTAPIGIHFGHSGWHAFHARARSVDELGGDVDSPEDVAAIRALARYRTEDYPGFDLILDNKPNPRQSARRQATA